MCKSSLPSAASSEQDLQCWISEKSRPDREKNCANARQEEALAEEGFSKKKGFYGFFFGV